MSWNWRLKKKKGLYFFLKLHLFDSRAVFRTRKVLEFRHKTTSLFARPYTKKTEETRRPSKAVHCHDWGRPPLKRASRTLRRHKYGLCPRIGRSWSDSGWNGRSAGLSVALATSWSFFFFCHKHFTIFTTEGALDKCEKGRRRRRRRSCTLPATETFLHSRYKTTAAISQARCASRRLRVRLFTRGAEKGKGRSTLRALRDARQGHADARPARVLAATTWSRVKKSVGRRKCRSGNGAIVDKPSGATVSWRARRPRRRWWCATTKPSRPALDMR